MTLADKLELVAETLSEISAYEDLRDYHWDGDHARVQFPRGYLRTLEENRTTFSFIENDDLKDRLAEHIMFRDTLHWIWLKTDIWGIARGMIIKFQLVNLGSILEGIVNSFENNNVSMPKKLQRMCNNGLITEAQREDLSSVWESRDAVHLRLNNVTEVVEFSGENYEFWHRTIGSFISNLHRMHRRGELN